MKDGKIVPVEITCGLLSKQIETNIDKVLLTVKEAWNIFS